MIAFEILWLKIYWYWIFYAIWFLVWYIFLYMIWKSKIFKNYSNLQNLFEKWLDDIGIWVILWVLIWWRLWHIIFYDLYYYIHNPLKIFAIREWWMWFVWWVIWVIIAIFIIKKIYRLTTTEFLYLIDCIVMILPFGIMIWRIWNYLNQELVWKIIMDHDNYLYKLWLIHIYDKIDNLPRINTNFLESFFEWFCLLVFLQFKFWKKYMSWLLFKAWNISWMFLIWYWIIRFFMEFMRDYWNIEYIWIFTKTQYFMIFFIILWTWLIWRKNKQ